MYVELFGGPQDGLVMDVPTKVLEIRFPKPVSLDALRDLNKDPTIEVDLVPTYKYRLAQKSKSGRYVYVYIYELEK